MPGLEKVFSGLNSHTTVTGYADGAYSLHSIGLSMASGCARTGVERHGQGFSSFYLHLPGGVKKNVPVLILVHKSGKIS